MGNEASVPAPPAHTEETRETATASTPSASNTTMNGVTPSALVLVGPSGVGKNTLIGELLRGSTQFGFSISHTTRQPRPGEKHGKEYYFVSKELFCKEIAEGKFLEYAEVHGRLYGTSAAAVQQVLDDGKVCILDVDVQGARLLRKSPLRAIYVFIAPPSLEDLARRLAGRGTETAEQIRTRMDNAKAEIHSLNEKGLYDYLVINDNLAEATNKLRQIAARAAGGLDPEPGQVPETVIIEEAPLPDLTELIHQMSPRNSLAAEAAQPQEEQHANQQQEDGGEQQLAGDGEQAAEQGLDVATVVQQQEGSKAHAEQQQPEQAPAQEAEPSQQHAKHAEHAAVVPTPLATTAGSAAAAAHAAARPLHAMSYQLAPTPLLEHGTDPALPVPLANEAFTANGPAASAALHPSTRAAPAAAAAPAPHVAVAAAAAGLLPVAGMAKWAGKVVLVTGASSGIGAAVCEALAVLGMRVVAVARRKDRLEQLQQRMHKELGVPLNCFLPVVCDITKDAEVATLPRIVSKRWPDHGIDVLVNNAGMARNDASLFEGNVASWVEMLSTNVLGTAMCTRAVVQDMMRRGSYGHIINMVGLSGHRIPDGPQGGGFYCGTKAAVKTMTEGLRQEARGRGVPLRVSAISPGIVETEFFAVRSFGDPSPGAQATSQFKCLEPRDVAQAIVWCLSAPDHVEVNDVVVRPAAQML